MNNSASLILLGIYYGLLTTFSVGPSQLVCVRNFLLEGRGKDLDIYRTIQNSKVLVTTISAVIISKIIILVSIYFTPISSLLIKPFSSSIFFFLYIFFYWRRVSVFNRETLIREEQSFDYINILNVFLDIILVQILNPFIFPTPVLKRLLNVFLFRYSQMPFFLSGIVIGWISGQLLFIVSTYYLLIRLEEDTGIVYKFLKIILHQIFPPIFFTMCFLFLGRIPLTLNGKNITIERQDLQEKIYSNFFVSRNEIKRPSLRLIDGSVLEEEQEQSVLEEKNKKFVFKEKTQKKEQEIKNTKKNKTFWNKNKFSQYIFETCVSDGKRKLSYTYPQSLLIAERKFKTNLEMRQLSEDKEIDISTEWILNKTSRKQQLTQIFLNRMEMLDKGAFLDSILEKKIISLPIISQDTEQTLFKKIDSRLNFKNQTNNFLFHEDSSWLSTESDLWQFKHLLKSDILNISEIKSELELINPKNQIKKFLTTRSNSFDLSNVNQKQIQNQNTIELVEMYKPMPYWENNEIRKINVGRSHIVKTSDNLDFVSKNITRNVLENSLQNQRRKTLIWNLSQERVKTPLMLRVEKFMRKKTLKILWSLFSFQEKNQNLRISTLKKNISRNNINKNFDFPQYIRNLNLIVQSLLRKYVTLPILIYFKNCIAFILFQKIDWGKDWSDWQKETYEYHVSEGKNASINQFPIFTSWIVSKSCEIRIKNPFRLRLLEPSLYAQDPYYDNSSYLTVLGKETSLPSGKIKQQPAFFKPIWNIFRLNFKAIQLISRREINRILLEIKNLTSSFIDSINKVLPKYFVNFKNTENIQNHSLVNNNKKKSSQLSTESLTINTLIANNEDISLPPIKLSVRTDNESSIRSNFKDTFQIGIISYLKTDSVKIQKEIEILQNKLNNRVDIQNIYDTKLVHKNLLNQYSILGRPPVQVNLNEDVFFNVKIVSKESKLSIWYKYFQLKNKIIEIDRICSKYIIKGKKSFVSFIHSLQKSINQTNPKLVQFTRQIIKKYKYFIVQIRRDLINIVDNFYFNFNIFSFSSQKDSKTSKKQYMSKDIIVKSNTLNGLSQALIFHKIWQTKIINTFNLNSLMSLWSSEKYLENNFQSVLRNKGIFNEKSPSIFTTNNWEEWIHEMPRYTPSSKVWTNISPKMWNIKIEESLKKDEILKIYLKQQNNQAIINSIGKEFSYHKPLLGKANKLFKRWKFDLILQNYINNEKNGASTYQNLIQLGQIKVNTNKEPETFLFNNVVIENSLINNEFDFNNHYEWGSTRIRQERFAPYLPFASEDIEFDNLNTNKNIISKEKSEVTIIDDERILRNIVSPFFRFINRQQEKIGLNITELLLSDVLLDEGLFLLNENGFIPENIFLFNKIKELRVLESLNITKNFNEYEETVRPNKITKNPSVILSNNLFLLKNIPCFSESNKKESPLLFNKNDGLKYDHILKRLLWPIHHLEDLACINRFSIDSSNQSRFSTLRIKMYPFIYC